MISCVHCGSQNVYYSKKKCVYVCEDCEKTFLPQEKKFVPKKVFLSYGHDENAWLVKLICEKLRERGHLPWIDYAEIKTGNDWRDAITRGILDSSGFLAFVSNYSVRNPGVCLDEISIGVGNYNCRIHAILLEKGVEAPNSISNHQWLDLSDWREKRADPDPAAWEKWFAEKFALICALVEDERGDVLSGNIERLQRQLSPITNSLKMRLLLQDEIIPRKWLVDLAMSPSASRATVVYGSPGTGKSVLSAYLCGFSTSCIAAHYFEWNNSSTRDARKLICSVAFQLACALEDYQMLLVELLGKYDPALLSEDDLIDRLLLEPLNLLIDGGRERKIIIFDALDEAVTNQTHLLDVMLRITEGLPGWIRVFFTSRPEAVISEALQQYRSIRIDDHRCEIEADIREYVRLRVDDESVAEKIIARSDGSFICAREMIKLLSQTRFDPDRLPSGLGGAYYTNFRRVFPTVGDYSDRYKPLFELLLVARRQLTEAEVCSVLGLEPEALKMQLRKVRSYVYEMQEGSQTVLQVFHKSFLEWMTSEGAGAYRVFSANGDRRFAANLVRCAREEPPLSEYAVLYGPSHFDPDAWDEMPAETKRRLLDKLLEGARLYGRLDLEKSFLIRFEDEIGKDCGYYMHLLDYYKKTSGSELAPAAAEALGFLEKNDVTEKEAFDLTCQAAYSYFYAGQAGESFGLITAERKKHGKDFWKVGVNEANYWHVVALTAHDLDNNREVVKAADNDVKQYRKEKKYYDLIVSMVNLFDGYMALGRLEQADKISSEMFRLMENRYYIHADDIAKLCYANLLQTEGRIMESLKYYEEGLKIASQIHDWDYLYGSVWRELAVARFGDRASLTALENLSLRARKGAYRYLASLADCFQILGAWLLHDADRLRDETIYARVREAGFPGHMLQAYCCRVLGEIESFDTDIMCALLERCEGVKGEPVVIMQTVKRFCKDMDPEHLKQAEDWCKTYVSGITAYRERFDRDLVEGLPKEPVLANCFCGSCQSVCCYDGVYLTPEEERRITEFVEAHPEHFEWLKRPFIVDGDWPGMRSRRKTEKTEAHDYDASFPAHFTKTKCVFELPSGQCGLQRAATDLQMHPWHVKPMACWSFPIRKVEGERIQPPITDLDEDPDYINESYPGYVSYLPCVKHGRQDGVSWTVKYRNEIEYIRCLGRDFK